MSGFLTGSAASAFEKMKENALNDWEVFKQAMSKELGESTQASQGKLMLHIYNMDTPLV